jgi:predicted acylesterase/phospholipase RssA
MRLAYQAGVLKALEEAGLHFTHVDGTSGGIFNAAMLASGLDPDEIAARWRKLNVNDFVSYRPLKEYFTPLRMQAVGDADRIRKRIFPQLGIDIEKIRSNRHITSTFNACNFSDKSVESIPHDAVTEDHLIAGMSLPVFMPAIPIGNRWYTDAVWIKDANLMEAVRRGAEELWLVWAIGNSPDYLPGAFNQYVHMIEMSANGGLLEEYEQIKLINDRICKGDSPFGQARPIRLFVIKPEYPLPLDPDLFFGKIDTTSLINMGYDDAKKYLERDSAPVVGFNADASKMKSPGITLTFRQKFTGKLRYDQEKDDKYYVEYKPSFTLRDRHGELSLQHCSSIYIKNLDREIPTKNNRSRVIQTEAGPRIEIASDFQQNGITYSLRGSLQLNSVLEWALGLEFKKISIQIIRWKGNADSTWLHGQLRQSVYDRLKHLLKSALRNYYGKMKLAQKYRTISKMYHHEI